jgi:FkbM family methyltransferase
MFGTTELFISYAQNFEDVMLHRALKHVEKGFYIDIGAQDPVIDSVSLAFYNLGWRGLHVEPASQYAAKLRSARPDEDVVEAAVGAEGGLLDIYEIKDTGLSTGKADIAERHRAAGFAVERRLVVSIRLDHLLDRFQGVDIHWLKIDVEGMEKDVIAGWGRSPVRPWIVVVESTQPLSSEPSFLDWESDLLTLGYRFAYFDGLNRFYVSLLHDELMAAFQAPPNVFDDFALGPYSTSVFASAFKSELKTAQASLEQVRVELAAAAEQLAVANEQKALADGEVAEARAELAAASERLAVADQQRALAEDDLAKTRAEATSLSERLVAADEQRALAEDVLAETRAELTSATERLVAADEQRARAEDVLAETRAELTSVNERLAAASAQHSSALAALAKMEEAFGLARSRPLNNFRMYLRWKAALFWLRLSPLLSSSRVDRLIHRAWKYAPSGTFREASALTRRRGRPIGASSADPAPDVVHAPSEERDRAVQGGDIKTDIAHAPRNLGRRLRRMAGAVAFHSSGKPRRLVRQLLFHTNGRPRRPFQSVVLRADRQPKPTFRPWLTSASYQSLRRAVPIRTDAGPVKADSEESAPETSARARCFADRLVALQSQRGR